MRKDAAAARDIAELVGLPPIRVRRNKQLGPLHDLLLKACPPDAEGVVSTTVLARHLQLTQQAVQKWIANDSIPPKQVKRVVELSQARTDVEDDGKVTLDDFSTWVYG